MRLGVDAIYAEGEPVKMSGYAPQPLVGDPSAVGDHGCRHAALLGGPNHVVQSRIQHGLTASEVDLLKPRLWECLDYSDGLTRYQMRFGEVNRVAEGAAHVAAR